MYKLLSNPEMKIQLKQLYKSNGKPGDLIPNLEKMLLKNINENKREEINIGKNTINVFNLKRSKQPETTSVSDNTTSLFSQSTQSSKEVINFKKSSGSREVINVSLGNERHIPSDETSSDSSLDSSSSSDSGSGSESDEYTPSDGEELMQKLLNVRNIYGCKPDQKQQSALHDSVKKIITNDNKNGFINKRKK